MTQIPKDKEVIATNECFVIMPISNVDGYPHGHFDHVYRNIICPSCEASGFKPFRADEDKASNLIQLEILRKLLDAPLVICDLSTRNPNVLFELGIRQAFDKPVVLIQEEGTPSIFDIGTIRFLTYKREMQYQDVLETQKQLKEAILATSDANAKGKNSIVSLLGLDAAKVPIQSKEDKKNLENEYLLAEIQGIKEDVKKIFGLMADERFYRKTQEVTSEDFYKIYDKNKNDPKYNSSMEFLIKTIADAGIQNYEKVNNLQSLNIKKDIGNIK